MLEGREEITLMEIGVLVQDKRLKSIEEYYDDIMPNELPLEDLLPHHELLGINEWCVNEGRASMDDTRHVKNFVPDNLLTP